MLPDSLAHVQDLAESSQSTADVPRERPGLSRGRRWRCLFQRPRTLGKLPRRAFSRPLETLGGASALCRGDGGGKRWSDAAGTQRRRATRDSGRGALLAILSLEGAHMLGPRGVRSQALRLMRLDIAANAGAAYLTLNHFSHPDISQAGYASLNPWRGRKGAGLGVRHRILGRAYCMTGGVSRRVAVTRAENCRRCDAVSHRERARPSLS